ncbi:hypothetical protein ACFP65_09565 [Marinilactibacillus sp. GCM10026970]|uniref:hypothetical protein n=1 Tax=Marinilactibacillus sp. GCM10026970 TaxID=3252642 RepID=UPI00361377C7
MVKVKIKTVNSNNSTPTKTSDVAVMIRKKRFGLRTVTDLERKRPRNINEKRQLKQWEKERGDKKKEPFN